MRKLSIRFSCFAAAALAGIVTGSAIAQEIDDHPDFSGVWTSYRGPTIGGGGRGGFGGRGGGAPLTALAQQKVDAYRAVTQGTNHSPGAYCVGSGMPGSMTGSGGYPMEILQHPRQLNVTYEAQDLYRRPRLRSRRYLP
jgi:hypothetical protein